MEEKLFIQNNPFHKSKGTYNKKENNYTMNDKFKLLENETIEFRGKTLYRIESLKNFGNVSKGEKGGYIEKEENLSEYGKSWVSGDACVCNDAWVFGNAHVYGNAQMSGNTVAFGNAQVYGNAVVSGHTAVSGNAQVYGNAHIAGKVIVSGNAMVYGNALVFGNASVCGNARVLRDSDVLVIGPIGSENGNLTSFKDKNGGISVNRGCFNGSLEEFEKAVNKTHGDNEHGKVYRLAIELIKVKLDNLKD